MPFSITPNACPQCGGAPWGLLQTVVARFNPCDENDSKGRPLYEWTGDTELDTQQDYTDDAGRLHAVCRDCGTSWPADQEERGADDGPDLSHQYTAETCPGRYCSTECDHVGAPPEEPSDAHEPGYAEGDAAEEAARDALDRADTDGPGALPD